ncbi:MAG: hypothetical protein L0177_08940 [Chloroflexi bacterium]|nr:hypothetical protein [Chloroflexota bacterium]
MAEEGLGDGRYLLRRLALSEDDFGKALPQRAVMVNLGEVQVFVGQASQLGDDLIYAESVTLELAEQRPQASLVYGWPPVSAPIASGCTLYESI